MALIMAVEHARSGVFSSYWRIVTATVYVDEACADVDLAGYVDQDARLDGRSPLDALRVRVSIVPDTANRENLYLAIKALPGFETATDEPPVV